MTPINLKDKAAIVPCGKCPGCLKTRISNWSFRLMEEDKVSLSSFFLTLTYDTDHVPITPNGFMSLAKSDLQKFFKKLRKQHAKHSKTPIKYYAVGEYGERSKRPHYHVIIFNSSLKLQCSPSDFNLLSAAPLDGKTVFSHNNWDKGHATIGLISQASVGYTLKYINKKYFTLKHKNDDRQKEFSLMSKGLGKSYITDAWRNWHTADLDTRMYVNIDNGKKASMPRYYKEKIYAEAQRQVAAAAALAASIQRQSEQLTGSHREYLDRQEAVKAAFRKHRMEIKKTGTL